MTGFGVNGSVSLGDFHRVRPRCESTQEQGFDWLTAAHAQSAALADPSVHPGRNPLDALKRKPHIRQCFFSRNRPMSAACCSTSLASPCHGADG